MTMENLQETMTLHVVSLMKSQDTMASHDLPLQVTIEKYGSRRDNP
jgi:hypothetical protein